MRLSPLVPLIAVTATAASAQGQPVVADASFGVQYLGFERNGIEIFQNIKYGEDTSGANRFKPPRRFKLAPGIYDATQPGPACPQNLGSVFIPLALGNITEISEDCLNLNIARPAGMEDKKLPVMLWIHGGSFWAGSNTEPTTQPDGLILQSIKNGLPVIHVGINYRLGLFGFAQHEILRKEKSENAGLRDQRLAIEWVRDNIATFGGDPEKITIFGQSSGGLAVGLQLMAYGGTEPLPFQQGICQSQALEPGLTGNFTKDAMDAVLEYLDCKEPFGHEMQIQCLRSWDMDHLLLASIETYQSDISHNIGDIWLPSVDGDFLPAPPSQLLKEGRFGNATYMFGWTEDDLNYFTDPTIKTANDTRQFITSYLPGMPAPLITKLLDAYPVTDFAAQPSANLSAEFYRTARIFRDILMVCEPLLMADHMHKKYNSSSSNSTCTPQNQIFLYDFNQTILAPAIEAESGLTGLGVVHTSEFAYVFANLTHWNANGWPWHPTVQDNTVLQQASRSWSTFAATGRPSSNADGSLTLQGWEGAYEGFNWGEFGVPSLYVIGGPYQSFSPIKYPDGREGYGMFDYVTRQKLVERCGVINGEEFVGYLGF